MNLLQSRKKRAKKKSKKKKMKSGAGSSEKSRLRKAAKDNVSGNKQEKGRETEDQGGNPLNLSGDNPQDGEYILALEDNNRATEQRLSNSSADINQAELDLLTAHRASLVSGRNSSASNARASNTNLASAVAPPIGRTISDSTLSNTTIDSSSDSQNTSILSSHNDDLGGNGGSGLQITDQRVSFASSSGGLTSENNTSSLDGAGCPIVPRGNNTEVCAAAAAAAAAAADQMNSLQKLEQNIANLTGKNIIGGNDSLEETELKKKKKKHHTSSTSTKKKKKRKHASAADSDSESTKKKSKKKRKHRNKSEKKRRREKRRRKERKRRRRERDNLEDFSDEIRSSHSSEGSYALAVNNGENGSPSRKTRSRSARFSSRRQKLSKRSTIGNPANLRVLVEEYNDVSVFFADVVSFTTMSSKTSAIGLVKLLNHMFEIFDQLATVNGVEKIKTIGDCYFAATGLPDPNPDHAKALCRFGLQMLGKLKSGTIVNHETKQVVRMRLGIHSSRVMAGIIGTT